MEVGGEECEIAEHEFEQVAPHERLLHMIKLIERYRHMYAIVHHELGDRDVFSDRGTGIAAVVLGQAGQQQ